jgi:hypothetical protein
LARARALPEKGLILDEVDTAVAPRVAAQQAPAGEDDSAEDTVAANRVYGVL